MRVPLSWLKDYVDITWPIPELAERMTLAGLEVAAIETVGLPGAELPWDGEKITVGQIVEVKPHPNADRLVLAVVDYGGPEYETCVTGAPNLFPFKGQTGLRLKVAFAMEGARLYDGHAEEKKLMTLKRAKIRGVPSRAMVCSEKELDLGDDHTGIMILPADAPAPGTPLADYLGDVVFDLDLTPNLARCFSMVGVAREVAALTGAELRLPDATMIAQGESVDGQVKIVIEDSDLCHRYSATIVRDVTIGPSPFWMQRRLTMAGMRPINNIVDVTNYVMLELGQPLHAFDYDLLLERARQTGHDVPVIIMRRARPGERMTTLDDVERELAPDMLMITDTAGPIAVGGVMGGVETEIDDGTRNILLESASFDFINNRRTAQTLKIPSEATARFGRGVPASGTTAAARRASEWMRSLASGEIARGVADVYPVEQPVVAVKLPVSEVERIVGIVIAKDEIGRILEALEFTVADGGDVLVVTAPQHRLDVSIPADLIEEIARVYGYDRIPTTLLSDELPPQRSNVELEIEEQVRDILVGAGLQEVITYSLGNLATYARLTPSGPEPDPDDHIRLANPLTPEREFMRRTLMTSLLETVRDNLRFQERIAIFEIGRVYWPREGETLPQEPRHLCLAMTGPRTDRSWLDGPAEAFDFYDLKGAVEALLDRLNLTGVAFAPASHPTFHPGRSATLSVGGVEVGVLGEVHPDVCEAYELGERCVCLAEFNLEELLATAGQPVRMTPISPYPAVYEDVALVVDDDVPASRVNQALVAAGGKLLRHAQLFDVYRGDQLPAGKKSLAFSLTYQAMDRSLTSDQVARERQRMVRRLEREIGARLRE
ncbi:MAG: phenylalanine--tRNA ligase subunit beta [Anaerolineae bacterium]|nr:MAG: phenylalanine--tRNA ligase subunit beta [Anaerolineae bacterium]